MDDETRLKQFSARLSKAAPPAAPELPENEPQAITQAMRTGIEIVAGVAAGMLLGYMFDSWLNTSPLFILLGLVLGFFAALRGLMRSIKP